MRIKSKTLTSKKKEGIFCAACFIRREFFLRFVFYLNVQSIEYTFRIYILLRIKKHFFISLCLYLKSPKNFSVSLSKGISNVHSEVTIKKKWCSQNLYFRSLKILSPGQFLGSSTLGRYHWISKLLAAT